MTEAGLEDTAHDAFADLGLRGGDFGEVSAGFRRGFETSAAQGFTDNERA